jgi:2-amino-4-hydroxy-6-hydroxymethyldihydropteridine diphosphokinase
LSVTCYVGLGSNVGDRIENLRRAVALLDESEGIDVARTSSVYETDPVGPPQPDFLNAVAEIVTTLRPHDLLARLKETEAEIGRSPTEQWGPREIDLDLLTYGDQHIEDDDLCVPHPRMGERAFVLVPLAELTGSDSELDSSGVRRFPGGLR